MDQPRDLGIRSWALVTALGLLVTGAAVGVAGDQPPRRGPQPAPGAQAPGMVIYRDPATGRFVPPPAGAVPTAPRAALTAPAAPVAERAGTTPGGGVIADLQGRGIRTLTATKEAAGKVHVGCRHGEVE